MLSAVGRACEYDHFIYDRNTCEVNCFVLLMQLRRVTLAMIGSFWKNKIHTCESTHTRAGLKNTFGRRKLSSRLADDDHRHLAIVFNAIQPCVHFILYISHGNDRLMGPIMITLKLPMRKTLTVRDRHHSFSDPSNTIDGLMISS